MLQLIICNWLQSDKDCLLAGCQRIVFGMIIEWMTCCISQLKPYCLVTVHLFLSMKPSDLLKTNNNKHIQEHSVPTCVVWIKLLRTALAIWMCICKCSHFICFIISHLRQWSGHTSARSVRWGWEEHAERQRYRFPSESYMQTVQPTCKYFMMSLNEKTDISHNFNWIPTVCFCRIAGLGGEIKDFWSCPHWWVRLLFISNFKWSQTEQLHLMESSFCLPPVFNFHQAVDGIQEQQRQQQEGKK